MRTLAIIGSKGGTGRTTLAVHLAAAAALAGRRPLLLDFGTNLGRHSTLTWWSGVRAGRRRRAAVTAVRLDWLDKIEPTLARAASDGHDITIIDHYERYTSAMNCAARHADLTLIPTRLDFLDMEGSQEAMRLAQRVGRPWAIVLNQIDARARRSADVRDTLEQKYVAPVCVTRRLAYADALADGAVVQETAPTSKAAAEIGLLWNWVSEQLLETNSG